eukprot:2166814-Amphidinium_carterae.3
MCSSRTSHTHVHESKAETKQISHTHTQTCTPYQELKHSNDAEQSVNTDRKRARRRECDQQSRDKQTCRHQVQASDLTHTSKSVGDKDSNLKWKQEMLQTKSKHAWPTTKPTTQQGDQAKMPSNTTKLQSYLLITFMFVCLCGLWFAPHPASYEYFSS